jgi:flagellar basal body-associated protein FliL
MRIKLTKSKKLLLIAILLVVAVVVACVAYLMLLGTFAGYGDDVGDCHVTEKNELVNCNN